MSLAHILSNSGGPDVELLIAAFGAGVLGIVFFMQKAVKPQVSVVLLLVAVALGITAFSLGGSESGVNPPAPDVALTFVTPSNEATVPSGEDIEVTIDIEGGQLVTDPNSTVEGGGHLHIYVDGVNVSMPTTETSEIELERGVHVITAEFVSPDHHQFSPRIFEEIEVTADDR
ncbi:MAG: hypothetical protein GEU71_10750 [Actinobacteria bacterium]|nr:hypothetical protein [Actinomycetota bacterium]